MRLAETGFDLDIQQISAELGTQIAQGLQNPKVAAELEAVASGLLASPSIRKAARPLLIEAALWVGGAALLGTLVARRLG